MAGRIFASALLIPRFQSNGGIHPLLPVLHHFLVMSHTLYLIFVSIHILAAMVWIGGNAAIGLVLVRTIRDPRFSEIAMTLLDVTTRKFRWVGWISLVLLIGTGIPLAGVRGYQWTNLWHLNLEPIFAWKLGLVTVLVILHALHDLVIGPKAITAISQERDEAVVLRKQAGWLGRITMLLSVVVVILAIIMVRGAP